ncbi:MAG: hypothetical protein AAB570_02240 [Patescibacteria group bacterium]
MDRHAWSIKGVWYDVKMKKKTQRIILAIISFFVIISMIGFTLSFGY